MRYFLPTSPMWWVAVFLIITGIAQVAGLIPAWAWGEVPPAALIGLGVVLLDLRGTMFHVEHDAEINAEERHREVMAALTDGGAKDDDARFEDFEMPDGENPLPPGVIDPFGPDGSRG